MFAEDLGCGDLAAAREVLAGVVSWVRPAGRAYFTAPVTDKHPLLEGSHRAFFLKVEPGGEIHPHMDSAASEAFDTDLIVVETNPDCAVWWKDGEADRSMHLALGHRYRMRERGVLHWSFNHGDTDRVHLLIEYPKDFTRRRG